MQVQKTANMKLLLNNKDNIKMSKDKKGRRSGLLISKALPTLLPKDRNDSISEESDSSDESRLETKPLAKVMSAKPKKNTSIKNINL